jgi:hypothetical protein
MKTASANCPVCNKTVRAFKNEANHLIHGLTTVFTCGLWVIVWIIAAINAGKAPWRCQICGTPVEPHV